MNQPAANDKLIHQTFLMTGPLLLEGVRKLDDDQNRSYRIYGHAVDNTMRMFMREGEDIKNICVPSNGRYVGIRFVQVPPNADFVIGFGELTDHVTNSETYVGIGYKVHEAEIAYENMFNWLANGITPKATEEDV